MLQRNALFKKYENKYSTSLLPEELPDDKTFDWLAVNTAEGKFRMCELGSVSSFAANDRPIKTEQLSEAKFFGKLETLLLSYQVSNF